VAPRRKLIDEGKPCGHLFILKSGWLAEFRQLRDGGRQILNFRLPGDIVGIECLAYRTALHSTVALTRCQVAQLPPADFERIQREFPRLATALFLMTLREGAILHEWEVRLGRRLAFSRIAHLLLELERRLRNRGLVAEEDRDIMPFPLTQQDIADCTGLSVPYVNRNLQRMRDEGFIRLGDRKLEMLDRPGLAKAAGFAPEYVENWGQGWTGRNLREAPSR
jgi:CRP-like cAMP-binding protein